MWYRITFNAVFACSTILYIILAVLGTSLWSFPVEYVFLAIAKLRLLLTSCNKRSGSCQKSHNIILPGLILDITTNILSCGGSIAIIGYFDHHHGSENLASTQVRQANEYKIDQKLSSFTDLYSTCWPFLCSWDTKRGLVALEGQKSKYWIYWRIWAERYYLRSIEELK